MHNRPVNFYIAALVITVIGALAAFGITKAAYKVNTFKYDSNYFAPERGEARTP